MKTICFVNNGLNKGTHFATRPLTTFRVLFSTIGPIVFKTKLPRATNDNTTTVLKERERLKRERERERE